MLPIQFHRRGAENAKEAQRGKLRTLQRLCETSAELCASAVEKPGSLISKPILNETYRTLAQVVEGKSIAEELPLELDGDPFDEPVVIEITDTIDLHSIPPKQIREIVEEYLLQAHARDFSIVRIIHGKGIGVQREAVRSILSRTEFVASFYDAPGNLGATIAELSQQPKVAHRQSVE